jgi:hypothetical protein
MLRVTIRSFQPRKATPPLGRASRPLSWLEPGGGRALWRGAAGWVRVMDQARNMIVHVPRGTLLPSNVVMDVTRNEACRILPSPRPSPRARAREALPPLAAGAAAAGAAARALLPELRAPQSPGLRPDAAVPSDQTPPLEPGAPLSPIARTIPATPSRRPRQGRRQAASASERTLDAAEHGVILPEAMGEEALFLPSLIKSPSWGSEAESCGLACRSRRATRAAARGVSGPHQKQRTGLKPDSTGPQSQILGRTQSRARTKRPDGNARHLGQRARALGRQLGAAAPARISRPAPARISRPAPARRIGQDALASLLRAGVYPELARALPGRRARSEARSARPLQRPVPARRPALWVRS